MPLRSLASLTAKSLDMARPTGQRPPLPLKPEVLAHAGVAREELQKALASLGKLNLATEDIWAATGQVQKASRLLKRASEEIKKS